MSEKIRAILSEETRAFILKIIVPALVALSIKIAIMNQQKKVSILQVATSFITGIGSAYIFADFVMESFEHQYIPLVIATITISGEKIGYYVIYKFNVDNFIESFINKHMKK